MNERIAQYRDRLTGYWNQFSKKQKTLLIATIAFVLLAVILMTIQFSKTEYEVAFTDLDSTDAAGIIKYLESGGIPYKLNPDGTAISVPSKTRPASRWTLGRKESLKAALSGWKLLTRALH